jgi:hypothetical protein
MKLVKSKVVIAYLIMLAMVVTSGTFAFWATSVDGTEDIISSQMNIGAGNTVQTMVSVSTDSESPSGYLVPVGQAVNSVGLVTESVDFLYELLWTESQSVSQIGTDKIYGTLESNMTIEIYSKDSSEALDKTEYKHIYDLVYITLSEDNPVSLLLNDTNAKVFGYSVGLYEPSNVTDYNIISESTIYVNCDFTIDTNIFDLHLDFTTMSQEKVLMTGVVSRDISAWTTDENAPLTTTGYTHEKYIFFPITKDEYTLTVQANLEDIDSISGGYGILFDTYFEDDDFSKDNGYILQFDRGYADGEMIVRAREDGSERNPFWREQSRDANLFPTKYEDPSWWVATHEFKIVVSNVDDSTRQAEIFLDGNLLGVATYEDVITTQQTYVGFRLWGNSNTNFYTLEVE